MTVAQAPAATPDLAAIKQRQQATWASGDYHMIGTQIVITSELIMEALDVRSTERVLDVATGSGNAAAGRQPRRQPYFGPRRARPPPTEPAGMGSQRHATG